MSNSKKAQMLRDRGNPPLGRVQYLYGQEKALVPLGDGSLQFKGMKLTPTALKFEQSVSEQDMQELASIINRMDTSLAWWVGDLLNEYETRYGDIKHIADILGYKDKTVWQYKWVSASVKTSVRIEVLSFGHHAVVASLGNEKEQKKWLERAAQGDNGKPWSIATLRSEMDPMSKLSLIERLQWQYEGLTTDERETFINQQRRAAEKRIREADDILNWIDSIGE